MHSGSPRTLGSVSALGFAVLALASAMAQEVPTVSFGFSFPGSEPDKYAFTVPQTGAATYYSDGKLTPNSDSDNFRVSFTMPEATRNRIFDLAKRAKYFSEEVDSKKKGIASTGVKTLMYKDVQKDTKVVYNYSTVPAVQELTQIFQSISATLEFGRRLEYYHRYQKLALDDELKALEDQARQNNAQDLAAIAPVLEQIASDQTVINPVRARAQRLLAAAK